MAIKGLSTDTVALPCLGKLRKGAPGEIKNGHKTYGKDLATYRLDTTDATIAEAFKTQYNDGKRICIMFPYATKAENWAAWMEEYSAGGFMRRCDTETQYAHRTADGKISKQPVPCKGEGKCKCSRIGRLSVLIYGIQRMGYFAVETHSINDIANIEQALNAYQAFFGQLSGIPFWLSRIEVEISTPSDKGASGRARRKKWLMRLEVDPRFYQMWIARVENSTRVALLGQPDSAPAIRSTMPNDDDGDTLLSTDEHGEIIEGQAEQVPPHPLDPLLDEIKAIRVAKTFNANAARITELFALACEQLEQRGHTCEPRPATLGEAASLIEIMIERCIGHDEKPNQA
mgnify:CR=1 FL=1